MKNDAMNYIPTIEVITQNYRENVFLTSSEFIFFRYSTTVEWESNSAQSCTIGTYDREVEKRFLAACKEELRAFPNLDYIYLGEDVSRNCYALYRTSIAREVMGFQKMDEGADFDLWKFDFTLRFLELTDYRHVAQVQIDVIPMESALVGEDNPDCSVEGLSWKPKMNAILEDAFQRRGISATIVNSEETDLSDGMPQVIYHNDETELLSLIIPVDLSSATELEGESEGLLKLVIDIEKNTDYPNYEIVMLNYGTRVWDASSRLEGQVVGSDVSKRISFITCPMPYNISRIYNLAAEKSKGKYLVFLSNDFQIHSRDWLSRMAGYAALPQSGVIEFTEDCCIICKSLFEELHGFDERLSHAYFIDDLHMRAFKIGRKNRIENDSVSGSYSSEMKEEIQKDLRRLVQKHPDIFAVDDRVCEIYLNDENLSVIKHGVDLTNEIEEARVFRQMPIPTTQLYESIIEVHLDDDVSNKPIVKSDDMLRVRDWATDRDTKILRGWFVDTSNMENDDKEYQLLFSYEKEKYRVPVRRMARYEVAALYYPGLPKVTMAGFRARVPMDAEVIGMVEIEDEI